MRQKPLRPAPFGAVVLTVACSSETEDAALKSSPSNAGARTSGTGAADGDASGTGAAQ